MALIPQPSLAARYSQLCDNMPGLGLSVNGEEIRLDYKYLSKNFVDYYLEPLLVVTVPFCKLEVDYKTPLAGAVSEQHAVRSCIYNIRTGCKPFHDIDEPLIVQKLMNNEFPPTSNDGVFGNVVL